MDATARFRSDIYGPRRKRRPLRWWYNADGTVGGNYAWRRRQNRLSRQQDFDALSHEEKGDYIRGKETPQQRSKSNIPQIFGMLQLVCTELGALKATLAGAPGTAHCEETARQEEKDIAAQTAKACTEAYAAGRAAGERQASEERVAREAAERQASEERVAREAAERQASEERAAREAAEASARDIAVRVAALEAAAVMRDTEEAAQRSSRGGLAIELEEGIKKMHDLTMQLEELEEENAALKQEVTESSDEAGGGAAEQGEQDYEETGARASEGFEDGFRPTSCAVHPDAGLLTLLPQSFALAAIS